MNISSKTTISQLLDTYPFLVDFLVGYHPKFKLLKNKMMRATMCKMATLKRVSGIGEISLDTLIKDIAFEIEKQTGESVEIDKESETESSTKAAKTAELKTIILDLHKNIPFEDVKKRFDELIADVEPMEIIAMEEQLIKEGMPVEEVKQLSDLHVTLFKGVLDEKDIPDAPTGHPVHTFLEENKIFTNTVADMNLLLQQLRFDNTPGKLNELKQPLQEAIDTLSQIEIHYQRKENQLFPFLEKHGITAPPQVMWAVDDDIREKLKQTREFFKSQDLQSFLEKGELCVKAIEDMIYKENHILFPVSIEALEELEWIKIRKGENDIGYAFSEPSVDWPSSTDGSLDAIDEDQAEKDADLVQLDTGQMTVDQINLLLKHLPVDMTFVDENDQVRYFSAGKERLFPRSPGIIGRKVQNCHPPKSLDVVNHIVDEFKAGTKDNADFWIQLKEKFIYIRYFAVRDDEDSFRGTLEVSQDITDIRSLEGERRLLNWDVE
jgi:DUF438 domain-containing protein